MIIRHHWEYYQHVQEEKIQKSLTQPEQHGSHCVHGFGIGCGLLQGLADHGVGQFHQFVEEVFLSVMLIRSRRSFNEKKIFL